VLGQDHAVGPDQEGLGHAGDAELDAGAAVAVDQLDGERVAQLG
jgi:hypothetical protein